MGFPRTSVLTFSKCVFMNSFEICSVNNASTLSSIAWRRLYAAMRISFIALIDSRNCVGVTCIFPVSNDPETKYACTHPTLQFQWVYWGKLYQFTPCVISLHSDDLPWVVHPNLAHRRRPKCRVGRRWPKIIRRLGYQRSRAVATINK